ncbi:hypothetical protein WN944_026431 [Citrus x changshan-huyou]|uniref:Uncharacterized protein n=1 Tax=Citrus x changshan-huyou TaxID=2935761 RepID=A0AAP0LV29_9ROSI
MASDPTAIVLDLEEELRCLTSTPSQFSIFRVPQVLRNVNEKAYAPRLLSIGPYHHGKDQLWDFEKYKMSYLQRLLERRLDIPLSRYFAVMRELEETARNCFGGSISLNQDEFVKMMILDGCFIVEVFRKFRLDTDAPALGQGLAAYELHNGTDNSHCNFICSATEIQEAGIQFRKVEVLKDDDSLFDIKFENGVMKMPSLEISDDTETIFQNLIAYEQCSQGINLKHVIDYVKFLNCLINSSKDAELLRRRGIIDNLLGDDEVIATLLNKLCEGVVLAAVADFFFFNFVAFVDHQTPVHSTLVLFLCVVFTDTDSTDP